MNVGKTLFAQIMEFVPWTSFARMDLRSARAREEVGYPGRMKATHITKCAPVKKLRQNCGQSSDEVTAMPIPSFNPRRPAALRRRQSDEPGTAFRGYAVNARDLIESLNNLDEHERIEAKRAEQVGSSVLESVSAFANEPNLGGEWLLLDAEREEMALFPSYAVSGLDDPTNVFHPRLQGGAGEVPGPCPGLRQGLRFLKPVYGVGGAMREGQPMSAESIETVG